MTRLPKRHITVIIGSQSDLPQCEKGIEYLEEMTNAGVITTEPIQASSIHRNTEDVLHLLRSTNNDKRVRETPSKEPVQRVLIIGAGWANHLTGTCDAYLRYTLKNDCIRVIGVAFEDVADPEHTETAIRSIKHVPSTQVVFNEYVGETGFYHACVSAVEDELPTIILKEPPPSKSFTLSEALEYIQSLNTGEIS